MRIPDEETLDLYAVLTVNGEYDLLPYEEVWRDRGPLLQFYGYQLRRRYETDWCPSWENTDINPFFCEDAIDSSTPNVMDAIRTDDDAPVVIKATSGRTKEAFTAFIFTDGDAISDSRNHCVPILDTFLEDDTVYIVMPLLRMFNDPPIDTVAQFIDFVEQIFQGLEYMHGKNVAHRNVTSTNIMMDASGLYPNGFHPVRQSLSLDGRSEVVPCPRSHAPVRYYLINFNSAVAFERNTPSELKYANGKVGRDEDVPEFETLSPSAPYDPFKLDIFQFGNLLRKEFLDKYAGLGFLLPLVKDMTRTQPSMRPSAYLAHQRFSTIRKMLTSGQIRSHLYLKGSTDPFQERLRQLGIGSHLEDAESSNMWPSNESSDGRSVISDPSTVKGDITAVSTPSGLSNVYKARPKKSLPHTQPSRQRPSNVPVQNRAKAIGTPMGFSHAHSGAVNGAKRVPNEDHNGQYGPKAETALQ